MKRFLIILTISLFCVSVAKAQSASADTLSAKVDSLTTQLTTLQSSVIALRSTIATLEGKVNEVTAQNLALKHAISLQPTIAEDTSKRNINYRLIEATGNKETGELTFIISVMNKGNFPVSPTMPLASMTDEQGFAHTALPFESTIGEAQLPSGTELHPDVPVRMSIKMKAENAPQYAKIIIVKPNESTRFPEDGFTFRNIPIKWE